HFLDLVGATNLIPGPNSTELAIHIGHEKGGWKGLLLAGLCFILPAVLITGIFAWLYRQYGQVPAIQPFIYGIKPAIIAIILGSVFPLARTSLKSLQLIIIGLTVLAGALAGISAIYLMFGAGFSALLLALVQNPHKKGGQYLAPLSFLAVPAPPFLSAANTRLFRIFLKIGAVVYGSGYVLFASPDT